MEDRPEGRPDDRESELARVARESGAVENVALGAAVLGASFALLALLGDPPPVVGVAGAGLGAFAIGVSALVWYATRRRGRRREASAVTAAVVGTFALVTGLVAVV